MAVLEPNAWDLLSAIFESRINHFQEKDQLQLSWVVYQSRRRWKELRSRGMFLPSCWQSQDFFPFFHPSVRLSFPLLSLMNHHGYLLCLQSMKGGLAELLSLITTGSVPGVSSTRAFCSGKCSYQSREAIEVDQSVSFLFVFLMLADRSNPIQFDPIQAPYLLQMFDFRECGWWLFGLRDASCI